MVPLLEPVLNRAPESSGPRTTSRKQPNQPPPLPSAVHSYRVHDAATSTTPSTRPTQRASQPATHPPTPAPLPRRDPWYQDKNKKTCTQERAYCQAQGRVTPSVGVDVDVGSIFRGSPRRPRWDGGLLQGRGGVGDGRRYVGGEARGRVY